MRRGLTILELSGVLAIIAIITAICVPVYDVIVRRARAGEAEAMLHAIAHAEQRHYRDHGAYLACDPEPELAANPGRFPSDAPCWRQLGIQLDGDVLYRYAVAMVDGTFEVTAVGDLDRDGLTSRFTLHGSDLEVEIEDGLE